MKKNSKGSVTATSQSADAGQIIFEFGDFIRAFKVSIISNSMEV